MTQPTDDVRHFGSWANVPENTYLTKTQLAALDLPRRPGPLAAQVDGRDFRDKKTVIDLYRIDESTPSNASVHQLAAARARAKGDAHTCTSCGAHPERPCTLYQDDARLCHACELIRALTTVQREQAARRTSATEHAAEILADPRVTIAHADLVHRGTTASGTRRSPAAAHLTAIDTTGRKLIDVTVRLVGKRAAGVPDGALSLEDAAEPIRDALADRGSLLTWGTEAIEPIRRALYSRGWTGYLPAGYGAYRDLQMLTILWRGDIDPHTRRTRPAIAPGRADRMLYLLQQIAADRIQDLP